MLIYKQTDNKLVPIREKKVGLEKTLQNLVEANLGDVFGFTFVASEFPLNNLRIDTLAFDEEAKAFVVIEYKRDKNFTVIDQGYAYLALLLNNKADFVLEYNEKTKKNLRKDNIDWSQSRVMFVAQSFTKYQQEAIGFQDLPIELWEVKKYDEDLVSFNQILSGCLGRLSSIPLKTTLNLVGVRLRNYLMSFPSKFWSLTLVLRYTPLSIILGLTLRIKML